MDRLTDTKVRTAKTQDKPYALFDGHGLHLQIRANGGKLWRWKYRFQGAPRLMSLGPYPHRRDGPSASDSI